jgi:predicted enzyme related to lactoylglutathione lyase
MSSPTMAMGQICWNELSTPDTKKAKEFYGNVFGWQFEDINTGAMTYTLIKSGNQEFGGMWQIPTDQQAHIPPHWMAYIWVADVTVALDKAKKNGANVVKEVTQAGDKGKFAIITDVTGAHIALWEELK